MRLIQINPAETEKGMESLANNVAICNDARKNLKIFLVFYQLLPGMWQTNGRNRMVTQEA